MKPSELPKNKRGSIRINNDVLKTLEKVGLSAQKLLDWAIDRNVKINPKKEEKVVVISTPKGVNPVYAAYRKMIEKEEKDGE